MDIVALRSCFCHNWSSKAALLWSREAEREVLIYSVHAELCLLWASGCERELRYRAFNSASLFGEVHGLDLARVAI